MTTATAVPGLTHVPLLKVKTPRGVEIEVMGQAEVDAYEASRDSYLSQADYTVQSDLADLEAILGMELLVSRWVTWLLAGREYNGTTVDENQLRRMIQDYQDRITKKKESLKLDRKGRESDNAQSFDKRWQQLAEHCQEFGIMREKQLDAALEFLQTFYAVVAAYDRSNQEERERLGFANADAFLQFVRDHRPAFEEIDAYFRANSQRYWVRTP